MSRQNKQKRLKEIAAQVKSVHEKGNKIPRTKKLSSVNKGKCVIHQGRRVSLSNMGKKHEG